MKSNSFLKTCKSLAQAENACIRHMMELMLQSNPSQEDFETGCRLVEQLSKLHSDAMDRFVLRAGLLRGHKVSTLLKHSATTLTEALLMLDELATRHDSLS